MSATEASWRKIGDQEILDLGGEVLVSCFLGKVFAVSSERNAWWGSSSTTIYRDAVFPALEDAMAWVERRRMQGTMWSIADSAAIVQFSDRHAIVAVDSSRGDPFRGICKIDLNDKTFAESLSALRNGSLIGTTFLYSVAKKAIGPAELPFTVRRSRSKGMDVCLQWSSKNKSINLSNVCDIVKSLTMQLQ